MEYAAVHSPCAFRISFALLCFLSVARLDVHIRKSEPLYLCLDLRRAKVQLQVRRDAQVKQWNWLRCPKRDCTSGTFKFNTDVNDCQTAPWRDVEEHWRKCEPEWQSKLKRACQNEYARRHRDNKRPATSTPLGTEPLRKRPNVRKYVVTRCARESSISPVYE